MQSHPRPGQFKIWWLAIRPRTLSISVAPVLLGTALAWSDHTEVSWLTFAVILFSVLTIQIGTNLYNDAADHEKGADTSERLGPRRATQQGWLSAEQIKKGALVSFVCAFISGIYLAWLGGLAIIILGLISIACGYAYTGGPKPIAYSPLGEVFVMAFFGLAAVGGTYYLYTLTLTPMVMLFATTIGSMAAAILLVNNYRDLDQDRKANKLTLVHYIGRYNTQKLYNFLILYPYLLLFLIIFFSSNTTFLLLTPLFSLPLAFRAIALIDHLPISDKLNLLLKETALLQLIYTLLLCLGLNLGLILDWLHG
jgi:1,4-dihydroxy-2-naphthoate octaprenyltransferase